MTFYFIRAFLSLFVFGMRFLTKRAKKCFEPSCSIDFRCVFIKLLGYLNVFLGNFKIFVNEQSLPRGIRYGTLPVRLQEKHFSNTLKVFFGDFSV